MPRCAWGLCKSDSKYNEKSKNSKPSMVGVSFIPFPKPKTNFKRCKAWIKACGKKNFTIDNITRNTYVCSKHFHNGQPSELYPDPYPAQSSQMLQKMQPKQLSPKRRTQISLKKPKLMVDDKEISSTNESSLRNANLWLMIKKFHPDPLYYKTALYCQTSQAYNQI